MLILFDNGTPRQLRRHLNGHTVHLAYELGWHQLPDGQLLPMAEEAGYELLITTDHSIWYQQNLAKRNLAILLIVRHAWPDVREYIDEIRNAVNRMEPGDYVEIVVPAVPRQRDRGG